MRMKTLPLVAILVAATAGASNTGFKLRYPLVWAPGGTNSNWISFPFRYWPNKMVGQTPQNSLDACLDLNGGVPGGARVHQIARFDPVAKQYVTQPCKGRIRAFDLVPGEGYLVKPTGPGIVIELIGSHDDRYAPNKGGTLQFSLPSSDHHLISVPYHVKASNSIDLCQMINPGPVPLIASIYRFDTATDSPKTQACNTTKIKVFDLIPGEGYGVKPGGALGRSVSFNVW